MNAVIEPSLTPITRCSYSKMLPFVSGLITTYRGDCSIVEPYMEITLNPCGQFKPFCYLILKRYPAGTVSQCDQLSSEQLFLLFVFGGSREVIEFIGVTGKVIKLFLAIGGQAISPIF